MKPADITVAFVKSRFTELSEKWSARNTRMDDYEKLYLLDLWAEPAENDERRVTLPTCFNVVEQFRALFLTRHPVISVPPSSIQAVGQEQADLLEKYLYGAWAVAHMMDAASGADWYANCLGEGVIRPVYDANAVESDFPLLIQALDPRNVYAMPSARPFIDSEVIHALDRTRRDIESEWGQVFTRPSGSDVNVEDWLDQEVSYYDYWRVDIETAKPQAKVVAQRPRGVITRFIEFLGSPRELAPRGGPGGPVPIEAKPVAEASEPEPKRVRRRVVTNCVVADDTMVKEPKRLIGYDSPPFVRYPGIKTPLDGEDGALSVLFPVTGGNKVNGAIGVAAAQAEAVSYRQRIVEMYSNSSFVTDDQSLNSVDMAPGAINKIGRGNELRALVPPGPHPALDAQVQMLSGFVDDATLPPTMRGQYVGDLSGLALSTMTNPVLMKIAHRQLIREEAYQRVNEIILRLTEAYSKSGWSVWGNRQDGRFELSITPADIAGYYRNVVKLSASLPKDTSGELMADAQFVRDGLLSRGTFIDKYQQLKGLDNQSVTDMQAQILRDMILFTGETAKVLSEAALKDYSVGLAAALENARMREQQQQMPPGGPPGMPPGGPPGMPPGQVRGAPGPGNGPMMGMPPSVVPPNAMTQMVGQGGPEQLAAMMAMQNQVRPGGPPPGFAPRARPEGMGGPVP